MVAFTCYVYLVHGAVIVQRLLVPRRGEEEARQKFLLLKGKAIPLRSDLQKGVGIRRKCIRGIKFATISWCMETSA